MGYVRVSTEEQADSGLGLVAQRTAIEDEARRRGWRLVAVIEEAGVSARSLDRAGLNDALVFLDQGAAGTLLVAKLDRLTRSVFDLCGLMQRAERAGWSLAAADGTLDTTTPHGRAMAQVCGVFAELERALVGERTRVALAAKRSAGYRLGRPVTLPSDVRARIGSLRSEGQTLRAIAGTLNDEGIPTAHGGARWHASTVDKVLRSIDLDGSVSLLTVRAEGVSR